MCVCGGGGGGGGIGLVGHLNDWGVSDMSLTRNEPRCEKTSLPGF